MGELSCVCLEDTVGTIRSSSCILHAHIALRQTVELLKLQVSEAHAAGLTYDDIYPILRTLSDVGYFVE